MNTSKYLYVMQNGMAHIKGASRGRKEILLRLALLCILIGTRYSRILYSDRFSI